MVTYEIAIADNTLFPPSPLLWEDELQPCSLTGRSWPAMVRGRAIVRGFSGHLIFF